ncbi:MAG: Gfo/Idh/MocA family oxidoreductase [Paludibaculum sp.]
MRVIRESHVELAGVYDSDPERAQAAAREFGCRAYDSLEDLAGHAQAAIVAVPTSAHCKVACQLLERGSGCPRGKAHCLHPGRGARHGRLQPGSVGVFCKSAIWNGLIRLCRRPRVSSRCRSFSRSTASASSPPAASMSTLFWT